MSANSKKKKIIITVIVCVVFVVLASIFLPSGIRRLSEKIKEKKKIENTIHLTEASDLLLLNENPDAYFVLDNDINCGGVTYVPTRDFSGKLDGQGHVISNLNITNALNYGGYGLFASVKNAEIKNFALTNFTVTVNTVNNDSGVCAGGLVGNAQGKTTITNCFVQGTIYIDKQSKDLYVGGLVGYHGGLSLTVTECLSDVKITNNITDPTNYTLNMGGIIGYAHYFTQLEHCVFTGILDSEYVPDGLVQPSRMLAKVNAGGIVGTSYTANSTFNECVSAPVKIVASLSLFTSKDNCKIGGIIGNAPNGHKATYCYYAVQNDYHEANSSWSCYYSKTSNSIGVDVSKSFENRFDLLTQTFLAGQAHYLNDYSESVAIKLNFNPDVWYLVDGWGKFGLKPFDDGVEFHYNQQ